MRARVGGAIAGFVLLAPALLSAAPSSPPRSEGSRFGLGAHGVANIPISQDDAGAGLLYGLHARIALVPGLRAETSVTVLDNGNRKTTASGRELRLEAPEMTTFALDLLPSVVRIGSAALVGVVGAGWTDLDVPGGATSGRRFTTDAGLEVELSREPLDFAVGPRIYVIDLGGGATRKNLGILAGVTYRLP